jgi:O-antigen/teichoic acid export membrane protein
VHNLGDTVGFEYKDSLPAILIITGGYAVGFFGICVNPALYAFNKLNQYLVLTVICVLSFVVVSVVLLPSIGMQGAAWGQLACYVSGILPSAYYVARAYRRNEWRENKALIS